MYSEEDFLPISAMQHLAFCPRQCALIHIEKKWDDNILTLEGQILHEKIDMGIKESRPGLRSVRSLRLRSFCLGLVGMADLVEFVSEMPPYPVEYKRGRSKIEPIDEIQLCAQTFCLEEMMRVKIPSGAIFYGEPRRRQVVLFSNDLRDKTKDLSIKLHQLLSQINIPKAEFSPKCKRCSLINQCLPEIIQKKNSANNYFYHFFNIEDWKYDNEKVT